MNNYDLKDAGAQRSSSTKLGGSPTIRNFFFENTPLNCRDDNVCIGETMIVFFSGFGAALALLPSSDTLSAMPLSFHPVSKPLTARTTDIV